MDLRNVQLFSLNDYGEHLLGQFFKLFFYPIYFTKQMYVDITGNSIKLFMNLIGIELKHSIMKIWLKSLGMTVLWT